MLFWKSCMGTWEDVDYCFCCFLEADCWRRMREREDCGGAACWCNKGCWACLETISRLFPVVAACYGLYYIYICYCYCFTVDYFCRLLFPPAGPGPRAAVLDICDWC